MHYSISINLLDKETVEKLHDKIKPLIRHNNVLYTIKEGYDLFNNAFTWLSPFKEIANSLELVEEIHSLHSFGYQGFFKPSVAECLTFIEPITLCRQIHFYEVTGPKNPDDLNDQSTFINNGFHLAKLKLYWCRDLI